MTRSEMVTWNMYPDDYRQYLLKEALFADDEDKDELIPFYQFLSHRNAKVNPGDEDDFRLKVQRYECDPNDTFEYPFRCFTVDRDTYLKTIHYAQKNITGEEAENAISILVCRKKNPKAQHI